jgi:hypothetical protein
VNQRRPLVLTATSRARADAERLLPAGSCLENLVEQSLMSGPGAQRPRLHETTSVYLSGSGVIVELRREHSALTQRNGYRSIGVRGRPRPTPIHERGGTNDRDN